MRIGVVSDTHNQLRNVRRIVELFNTARVDRVVHTGDITQARTLEAFAGLEAPLVGVFGNNDEREPLRAAARDAGIQLQEPPLSISWHEKRLLVVHDPHFLTDAQLAAPRRRAPRPHAPQRARAARRRAPLQPRRVRGPPGRAQHRGRPRAREPGGRMAAFLTSALRDPERERFLADVLSGLRQPAKTLPCKYFYDDAGSKLFDQICELPEYYPTRTELAHPARARRRDGARSSAPARCWSSTAAAAA